MQIGIFERKENYSKSGHVVKGDALPGIVEAPSPTSDERVPENFKIPEALRF
jgi:hypothetical protein